MFSLLLDNERWKQADVPAEFQDLVDSIADGRITLPERKHTGTQTQFSLFSFILVVDVYWLRFYFLQGLRTGSPVSFCVLMGRNTLWLGRCLSPDRLASRSYLVPM